MTTRLGWRMRIRNNMARQLTLGGQEAEDLIEFLEENDNGEILFDQTPTELAAHIRELFGMISREQEIAIKNAERERWKKDNPDKVIKIETELYRGDFHSVEVSRGLFSD